jgi:3-oxoacyl-(acyl-carrier-protein) synthase
MDRRALFAADAAIQALLQSDVPLSAGSTQAVGVALGCELPGEGMVPTAYHLARTVGAGGPVAHIQAGAASGLMAIGEAAEWIRREDCAVAVAGGAETPVEPRWIEHYDQAGMLTHRNEGATAIRPYDAARDGIALSEGATMLVLEDEALAVTRGANILGYVEGYGASFNRAPVAQTRSTSAARCRRR